MPWQRHLLKLGLELGDDGHLAFREVRYSTPRQSGKTTVQKAVALRVAEDVPRSTSAYTAQTGQDARDVIALEWGPHLEELYPCRAYKANGSERIQFENGSRIRAVANTTSAGHGKTLELAEHDEIFSWVDDRLIQACRPAMITVRDAQAWTCSTMGTLESEVWHGMVDDGRARVEAGTSGRIAYVEYSAPDDADPYDPRVWWACMPALGFTVTEEAIRGELAEWGLDAFRRMYLNQRTETTVALIPDKQWRACLDPDCMPNGELHLALDVAPGGDGGRATAFVVCGTNRALGVVDHRPGVEWAIDRLEELDQEHSFTSISVDSVGPIRSLLPEIENVVGPKRLRVRGTADACAAAGRLHQAILEGSMRHRGQESLDDAVRGSAKRNVGDSWVFGRRISSADVSPLVAAALAHFAALEFGRADGQGIY